MKKTLNNILVTGAGGDSGLATIRILTESNIYNVIAADASKNSTGLLFANKFRLIPLANDKSFINKLKNIVLTENIDAIFPNVDEELKIFSDKNNFPQAIISPSKTIDICYDKLKTLQKLKEKTYIPKYGKDCKDFPKIIKPRISRGSRNIYKVDSEYELNLLIEFLSINQNITSDMLVIQEYLPGKEYTVDCLFDFDGTFILCIPRQRISTKGGISTIGKTIHDNRFNKIIKDISNTIEFHGPINIQFKEDPSGKLKLLEINPRLSGGLPITHKAGINLPDLALKLFNGEKLNNIDYNNISVFRYLKEF